MREFRGIGAVAAASVLVLVLASVPMGAGNPDDEWTFMVYLDADNNLETWGIENLDMLETVGSSSCVNFVVLMDTYSGEADLVYVEKDKSVSIGEPYGYPKEVNMADPAVLEEFIEIACGEYPATKNALILWDHGGGWRGLCWDDTTFEETGVDDCLTMVELRDALAGAYSDTKVVFDVLGFDLCLMAMPEVAYQTRDFAHYLVFSEETVPGLGFPYDAIARDITSNSTMDGRQLAEAIVRDYATLYTTLSGFVDWTMSAFDMAFMDDVTAAVDYLGEELLASLRTYVNSYQNDLITAQEYYYPYNVDLKGFALNLIADSTIDDEGIRDAAAKVVAAVSSGIVIYLNSRHNDASTGMSIYLPSTAGGMHSLKPGYIDVPFAVDTSWYDFVDAFSTFTGRTWCAEKWA